MSMSWRIYLSLFILFVTAIAIPRSASQANQAAQLVEVGAYKMFLDCRGTASGSTVILETGTGDSSEVWSAVQKQVAEFARACSYDRLGLGKSDKPAQPRTADEIVNDLHRLLTVARVPAPYVMVGHSIGGIYVRKYSALYPTEVTGIVLVDSAHEEQFARVAEISREWAARISSRFPADEQHRQGFLSGKERLTWHFDAPLVVIEHAEKPLSAAPDPMAQQSEVVFHVLQKDLAGRSKYGQLREAKSSGHYIQRDEPELVVQSIKDVIRESSALNLQKPAK
jgi:pimeloyl-ACP methyl ester carboxylesterase